MKPKQYVILTSEIWNMSELYPRERVLLALITGYCKGGGACIMSNAKLGEWLGVSPRQIQRYLGRMVDRELVYFTHNPQREIRVRTTTPTTPPHDVEDTPPTTPSSSTHDAHDTHIRKDNKMDTIHHNGGKEKIPTNDEAVATLRHLVDTIPDCNHVPYGLLSTMARDCLNYYEANDWRRRNPAVAARPRKLVATQRRQNPEAANARQGIHIARRRVARTAVGVVAEKGGRIAIVGRAPRRLDEICRGRVAHRTTHQTNHFRQCQTYLENNSGCPGIRPARNANVGRMNGTIPTDGQNFHVGTERHFRCVGNVATPPRSSTT